jgi:cytochrome d ubiquinol oxidase subunit I
MQTPAGFHIVGEGVSARAEIVDFWAMVFNPSSMDRLTHSVIGCWLAGSFLVISVASFYLLKKKHFDFATRSLKVGLWVASISLILQLISGGSSAEGVAVNQPAKFAAIEGLYKTERGVGLSIFGLPDSKEQAMKWNIKIPKLLSIMAFGDPDAEITGLDKYPRGDWPNVAVVFQTYHLMIFMWVLMTATIVFALYAQWRKKLYDGSLILKALVVSAIYPQIGNQAGWVTAEMGRYPWIVQDHLRISEGLSKSVTANQVFSSIIMFGFVYTCLFVLFVYLLNEKFQHGPVEGDLASPYHNLETVLK